MKYKNFKETVCKEMQEDMEKRIIFISAYELADLLVDKKVVIEGEYSCVSTIIKLSND